MRGHLRVNAKRAFMTDAAFPSLTIPDRNRPAAPVPMERALTGLRFLREVRKNPIATLTAGTYREPIFVVHTIMGDLCTVSDPAAIKRILLDNVENYPKGKQQQIRLIPALGNGLLTAEGASWRFQRRTAAPVFQHRRLVGFAHAMAAATADMLAAWERAGEGALLDISTEMMRLTYDIISRTVFSNEVALSHEQMSRAVGIYFDTIGRGDLASLFGLPQWFPTPSRLKVAPTLNHFRREVRRVVAKRRAQIAVGTAPDDLMTLLIQAQDPETGKGLSDEEVYDNIITFIGAGHETTANALAWTFYLLSEFPWADARLFEEVKHLPALPGADEAASLVYTRMVMEEAMRLYPPVPFMAREAVAGDVLCGIPIRAGSQILISPWLLHRHHRLWEEPELFAPERFAPERKERLHRFAYMPFGGGPRICIGMGFAMQEAMIILAMIARTWRLQLEPGHRVEPVARITLRPKNGLRMRLVRRT
jgi:cytochrome P450